MASNNSNANRFVPPGGGGPWKKLPAAQTNQFEKPNVALNKRQALVQLSEMFGSVLEEKVITSVASSFGWNVSASIEALMEMAEGVETTTPTRVSNATSRSQSSATKTNPITPRSNPNTPRSNPSTPRPNPSSSRSNSSTPRSNPSTPRHNVSVPRSNPTPPMSQQSHSYATSLQAIKIAYQGYDDSSDDADVLVEEEEEFELVKKVPLKSSTDKQNSYTETKVLKLNQSPKIYLIQKSISDGIKVVVIMRGLPGSGKSFMAKHLVRTALDADPSCHVFSTDDFFSSSGTYVFAPDRLPEAHNWNQGRVQSLLQQGFSPVVVDNTNTQAWEMKPYLQAAVRFGYEIHLLEPDTPWCWKEGELVHRNHHHVPRTSIRNMLDRYERYSNTDQLLARLNLAYAYGNTPPQRCSNPIKMAAGKPTNSALVKMAVKSEEREKPAVRMKTEKVDMQPQYEGLSQSKMKTAEENTRLLLNDIKPLQHVESIQQQNPQPNHGVAEAVETLDAGNPVKQEIADDQISEIQQLMDFIQNEENTGEPNWEAAFEKLIAYAKNASVSLPELSTRSGDYSKSLLTITAGLEESNKALCEVTASWLPDGDDKSVFEGAVSVEDIPSKVGSKESIAFRQIHGLATDQENEANLNEEELWNEPLEQESEEDGSYEGLQVAEAAPTVVRVPPISIAVLEDQDLRATLQEHKQDSKTEQDISPRSSEGPAVIPEHTSPCHTETGARVQEQTQGPIEVQTAELIKLDPIEMNTGSGEVSTIGETAECVTADYAEEIHVVQKQEGANEGHTEELVITPDQVEESAEQKERSTIEEHAEERITPDQVEESAERKERSTIKEHAEECITPDQVEESTERKERSTTEGHAEERITPDQVESAKRKEGSTIEVQAEESGEHIVPQEHKGAIIDTEFVTEAIMDADPMIIGTSMEVDHVEEIVSNDSCLGSQDDVKLAEAETEVKETPQPKLGIFSWLFPRRSSNVKPAETERNQPPKPAAVEEILVVLGPTQPVPTLEHADVDIAETVESQPRLLPAYTDNEDTVNDMSSGELDSNGLANETVSEDNSLFEIVQVADDVNLAAQELTSCDVAAQAASLKETDDVLEGVTSQLTSALSDLTDMPSTDSIIPDTADSIVPDSVMPDSVMPDSVVPDSGDSMITHSPKSVNTDQSEDTGSLFPAYSESVVRDSAESVVPANAESVVPPSADSLVEPDAESVVPANGAEIVVKDVAECVIAASAESVVPASDNSLVTPDSESVVPASAECVVPANAESVVPTSAESVVPASADSLVTPNAESVVPANTESVVPASAESVVPTSTDSLVTPDAESAVPVGAASLVTPNAESVVPVSAESVVPTSDDSLVKPDAESVVPASAEGVVPASAESVVSRNAESVGDLTVEVVGSSNETLKVEAVEEALLDRLCNSYSSRFDRDMNIFEMMLNQATRPDSTAAECAGECEPVAGEENASAVLFDQLDLECWAKMTPSFLTDANHRVAVHRSADTPAASVLTADSHTNTTHSDFALLEPDAPVTFPVLSGRCRNIIVGASNCAERLHPSTFMLDKGCSTSPVENEPGQHAFELLVELFPKIPRDDLREVFDKCQGEINWTVDLLVESGYCFEPSADLTVRFDDVDKLQQTQHLLEELNSRDEPLIESARHNNGNVLPPLVFAPSPTMATVSQKQPRVEDSRSFSVIEFNNEATGSQTNADASPTKKGAKKQSKLTLQLKRELEENFNFSDASYSEDVLRIRRIRHGDNSKPEATTEEAGAALPTLPKEDPQGEAFFDCDQDGWEEDEMTLPLTLDPVFFRQLQATFGEVMFPYPEGVNPVVELPVALARQIHGYLMESQQQQLELQETLFENMIQDEKFARRLQEEEELPPPDLRQIMDMEMAMELFKADVASQRSRETKEHMATRLSMRKLEEMFPTVDKDMLANVFAAHDYSFADTLEVLEASTGEREEAVKTVMSPEALLAYEKQLMDKAAEECVKQRRPAASATESTVDGIAAKDAAMHTAQYYRDEANRLYQLRNECFQKANSATRNEVRSYYAQVGHLYKVRIDEANSRAAASLLSAHALTQRSHTLDLHCLYVAEALEALDIFIDYHIASLNHHKSEAIFIVTGAGIHSVGGKPRIKPAVQRRLCQRNLRFTEVNSGLLRVVVNQNDTLTNDAK